MSSNSDVRGWRIALIAAALVNPGESARARLPDVLGILDKCRYGVLQLPPPGEHSLLLAVIADQVAEYAHHGYAVAAVGLRGEPADGLHWRRLAPLLRHRGTALPPRHMVRAEASVGNASEQLERFLLEFDLPENEQRHWRG